MASLFELANPQRFLAFTAPLRVGSGIAAALLIISGLYVGLLASPADYQQGDTVRIMYVHVPAAWMALFAYTVMTIASVAGFIWKHPVADLAARAAAPYGAAFTFLALVTGALWGKPMWGTWWVWDARLTSVLILFFIYLGYMAIWHTIEDTLTASKVAAVFCIVGFINIPIIKFSVDWWNSLHQPASVLRANGPSIDGSILTPLLLMGTGYMALFGFLLLTSMMSDIWERRLARHDEKGKRPVSRLVEE